MKNSKITIVAGSFGYLHKGHKSLLRTAMQTKNHVIIGLTSDAYASKTKHYNFPKFEERKNRIEEFLSKLGEDYEIRELSDNTGDSAINPDYEIIVVSRETEKNAKIINKKRIENGLNEMKIIPVDLEIGEDFFPISSRRIERGEIDQDGKRLEPIRVAVCTNMGIHKELIEMALTGIFGKNLSITGFLINQDSEQRPENAILDNDFSVCLSYEIKYDYNSSLHFFNIKCTILDRYGSTTSGYGPSIMLSDEMYHTYLMENQNGLDHILECLGSDLMGEFISESVKMTMEPRKKPWKYDLMDYFKNQD
ncbi:phosphopantetheine adenylyltransferase [Cuniculiplasma sp. SKW3]|uniref:phosphopantetheine adenylyltransferase n=1 Tax=Cuniculiplasma sp. SKW3 TaxID=3400170 RepID=UPI003FD14EF2